MKQGQHQSESDIEPFQQMQNLHRKVQSLRRTPTTPSQTATINVEIAQLLAQIESLKDKIKLVIHRII